MSYEITCSDIRSALEAGAQLIDVRSPKEYAQFALPSSLNMHIEQLADYLPKIKTESQPLIYCGTGKRSKLATQFLKNNGVLNAIDIGAFTQYESCYNR